MRGKGLGSHIFYGKEATWGTAIGQNTVTNIAYPLPGGIPSTKTNMVRRNYLSGNRRNASGILERTVENVEGSYNFNLSDRVLSLISLGMFNESDGIENSSPVIATNDLKHFTIYHLFNKATIDDYFYKFTGMCVNSFSISIPSMESLVTLNVSMLGQKQETPQFSSGDALLSEQNKYNYLYPSYLATLELDSVNMKFQSFTLNVNNNLSFSNYLSGDLNSNKPTMSVREVSGSFTILFENDNHMNFFKNQVLNKDSQQLILKMFDENGVILKVECEVEYLTGSFSNIQPGELSLPISFISIDSSSNADIRITRIA